MVDAFQLAYDITSVSVSTAIPGVAWALLFGLAWRYPAFAESLGLGRREFWLLLPGALLASFALFPLAPLSNDILAVSFAGAIFPLGVGLFALRRFAPPLGRSLPRLLAALGAEVVVMLAVVVGGDRGALNAAAGALHLSPFGLMLSLVTGVAVVAVAATVALAGDRGPVDRGVAAAFGLTSLVLVLTYAGARAIPGVGIAETFPYYLLPPVAAGVLAVVLARRIFPGQEGLALPLAFLASGWGVLLGADVLWQPPLYGTGPAGLYAIGGAGVLDLVYLSGFLGLFGAWWAHTLLGRGAAPAGPPVPRAPPSPSELIREAYQRGIEGKAQVALGLSAEAARAAGLQAGRLLGGPMREGASPWDGLPVPGWVVADTANLQSVARAGSSDPQEAVRAWVTARAMVQLGQRITRSRFATTGQRLLAFALDAVVLGVAAGAVFVGIVLVSGAGVDQLLSSVGYNAAVYGFVALALVYFAVAEWWIGATFGKWVVGIEVRDRALRRVDPVAAFVRNAPLLPAITLYSLGLAVGVAVALRGLGVQGDVVGVGTLAGAAELFALGLVVLVGILLAGILGVIVMHLTAEHQRVGDLWARTWVLRRVTGPAVPPGAAPTPARSG